MLKSTADTLDERRDAFFLIVDRNEDGKLDFAFRLVGEQAERVAIAALYLSGRSGFAPPCT